MDCCCVGSGVTDAALDPVWANSDLGAVWLLTRVDVSIGVMVCAIAAPWLSTS